MGIRIITNNVDRWDIFSSITDSVTVECKTEAGLKRFLALERIYKAKLKAIEDLMCFPRGYVVNDSFLPNINEAKEHVYLAWKCKVTEDSKTYEEYFAAIDAKLDELLALNPDDEDDEDSE